MKRLGQKICVAVVLSLGFVAIWHDSAKAAMPVITSLGQIKDGSVGNPNRIDVDAAGTIYLGVSNLNGVTRYNKYGKALPTLKGAYTVKPYGIAVTPDGSRVFVSVSEPDKLGSTAVAVLDGATGALLGYLGAGFNEFGQVAEIDLDGNGNLYVGDSVAKKINVYNGSTYVRLYSFGGPATNYVSGYYLPLPGQFGEVAGLTVDIVNNEVLVAEGWNNNGVSRVQVFGLDGTFKRLLPQYVIAGPGKVPKPTNLLVKPPINPDPENPTAFTTVNRVDPVSGYVGPTQVNCKPISLTVDPSGRIYMLSILTSTIHVFTYHPEAYWGRITKGTPDPAYDAAGKVYPWTVGMIPTPSFDAVYDPATGRLFVVTDGNGIQIFSVDGATNPVKANSAPETPAMLSPVQGSEVATLSPTLQWAAAVDADNDTLSYNVKISNANGAVVSSSNNVVATSLTIAAGTLLENNKYGWQLQAADAELTSSYSAIESFWVNAVEEAPSAALLVAPATAVTADKNTVFSWQAATDADPFDAVTYRLEMASGNDFTAPVITVNQSGLTSAPLSTLPGYAALKSGTVYQWRVVAVDGSGLTTASQIRSFNYISSTLIVDATFPGAKVYLGGNSAYSGRFVGDVPVELRDINPGTIEVVVERPGFEPWVKSVVVNAGQSVSVNAALVVAILPDEFKKAPFLAGGLPIQVGAEAAPVLVDFDSDGISDLLVAEGTQLLFYKGVVGVGGPVAAAVSLSGVTFPAGSVPAPFVADWNNDDRKDLLVGAADGSVSLYLNIGTQAAPVFAAAELLKADNAPLNVGSNAVPLLFDLDNDGDKDLLVGSGNGSVYKFLNNGSDAAPLLAAGEIFIAAATGAADASLVVTDWDADGEKEILLAANQDIAVYDRQADGSYGKGATLAVHPALVIPGTLTNEMLSAAFGGKVRLVAANIDGIRGKDLLIGNAAGEILLAESTMNKASAISPLFDVALLATVGEIKDLIVAHGRTTPLLTATLTQLQTNISSQAVNKMNFYTKAKKDLVYLQNALKSDVEISALLGKLMTQLNSEIPLN